MSFRRLETGGRIDRAKPLKFRFNGGKLQGFAGDTLASALLANEKILIGRSFKYHRPRGILGAGVEEPNALFTIGKGGLEQPNAVGPALELVEDLRAKSQNAWPSPSFDLRAINKLAAPLFGAGFYYKTFMGPARKAGCSMSLSSARPQAWAKPERKAQMCATTRAMLFVMC